MFCSNCGTNNADGVKFCSGCGAPMGTNNAAPVGPAPVYAPVEPQAPVYAPVEPQAPVYAPVAPAPAPQEPKKNNTGLIVGIIVGVLVVIGAVIAVLFATGTFDTDSKKEETTTEETDKKQNKDEDKDKGKEENKNENKEEGTTEQQKDEPVVGQKVEYGKVSLVASNDLVGNSIGVGDGKMYVYNDYPVRTENFTIETVAGAPDFVTEEELAAAYSVLNLSSYELKSFNTYAVSGFKYTKAVVAMSMNGIDMYADVYIIFVDGQCVMITFNSLGNTTSSGFADEIASIRVNGSTLP